jgi:hypothetical protein
VAAETMIMVLAMKEGARQKGGMLTNSLYLNTGVFCVLLFIIRYFQDTFRLSYTLVEYLIIFYCVSTLMYYMYSIISNLKSYFYAYALDGRKRSPLGAGLWFFVSGCLCVMLLILSWIVIASFKENVRAFLEHGAMRGLIAINIAAGLDVIIVGIFSSCLLSTLRRMRRVRLALSS